MMFQILMKIQQNQKKSDKITCFLTQNMLIVDANEKLVKELKSDEVYGK